MGGISGMLGFAGGAGGTGVSGPERANIISPATQAQADEQYKNVQQALAQQQAFLQATQAQGGLQNQSNVFGQLGNIAAGQGPNPAQAQLAQATGANVANQAALMAGQRGSSANAGLLARQAAMQGAATQQQAAGQGASLQAQQSLAALQNMGNLASQQAAQQAAATGAYTNAAQGAQSNILNAIANTNQANVGMQSNINSANAGLTGGVMGQQGQLLGNMTGGIGSLVSMYSKPSAAAATPGIGGGGGATMVNQAYGGEVNYADGGQVAENSMPQSPQKGPKSAVGRHFSPNSDINNMQPIISSLEVNMAQGGKVPAMVSPGEQYLPPKDVKKVVKEGKNPLEVGERIPGKPKVKGDSLKNDTVPKDLQAGGIVIPNSVMQSDDPPHEAYKFIAAIQARHGKQLPKKSK